MRAESKRHGRIRCSYCIRREACYVSLLLVHFPLYLLTRPSVGLASSFERRASRVWGGRFRLR